MPKVSRVGKFRATAKQSSEAASPKQEANDGTESKEPLSRGQRKRLAKREQYLKREKMVLSSLRLQKLEQQKGKLDGLDAIRESLPEFQVESSASSSKADVTTNPVVTNTNKSKKAIANTEISHMGLVLEHPAFKDNPFEAIQQHLRNSLASDAERLKQDSSKKTEEEALKIFKNREEKKERLRDAKFSKSKSSRHKNSGTARRKR